MIGCGIMSSVFGMILQRGSTIKVSTELPVATRHRHDMTEKLGRPFLGITSMALDLQHISHLYYVEHSYVSIFQGVAFVRNTMVTLRQIFFYFLVLGRAYPIFS